MTGNRENKNIPNLFPQKFVFNEILMKYIFIQTDQFQSYNKHTLYINQFI